MVPVYQEHNPESEDEKLEGFSEGPTSRGHTKKDQEPGDIVENYQGPWFSPMEVVFLTLLVLVIVCSAGGLLYTHLDEQSSSAASFSGQ